MKKRIYTLLYSIATALLAMTATQASAQTWDFSSVSAADEANLAADAANWTHETGSNDRYKNLAIYAAEPLKANGVELDFTKGLLFTTDVQDAIRIDVSGKRMATNKVTTITVEGMKAGMRLTMKCKTSSKTTARGVNVTNITPESGFFNATSLDDQTNIGTVTADGDVTITNTGGLYVYYIGVTAECGGGDTPDADDHSVLLNTAMNQARLTTIDNVVKYYNTADLDAIAMDKAKGTVTVTPRTGDWQDVFSGSVRAIGFSKASSTAGDPDITNRGVQITKAGGWNETAYAVWATAAGVSSYNVYVKGGPYAEYTKIDRELVRNYGSYGRADIVGLPAGSGYAVKVAPVTDGVEASAEASEAGNITVMAYDRSGFAHHGHSGVGAYADNGALKDGARVLYVTAATAKTVQLGVVTGKNGSETACTGLQAIVAAFEKGMETRPLAVRIIGRIAAADMDALLSGEGLQVKGKSGDTPMNITIEGIGEDATVWGFGFLLRNAASVELRNFAIMLCLDDCVSLDTGNKYCWIHNLDLFYGKTGSDSDQAKGDGTIDIKGKSTNITVAYNHFFDSGKSSLCGMKSEATDCYIDYHHNWFDHSDSRHPRVRTLTVHVWNNYYDGCSKYGVGATMGSSVFVEANYFRATKNPMLISRQGTDAKGDGTFSGEDGGMIKSWGNLYAEPGKSGTFTPVTQRVSATGFDCYEAASRDEQVPLSYVTLAGATTYSNFDTDPTLIYTYTPDNATEVPAKVTGYWGAGRINKGDFKWAFDNASEDTNYGVIAALKSALENYTGTLVGFF